MFGIGFQELLVIFLIVLLVFGAKRLPEIGRSLGKTMSEFRHGFSQRTPDFRQAFGSENKKHD